MGEYPLLGMEESMAIGRDIRRRTYAEKASDELAGLAQRGVCMGGNAFSSVLVAKGQLSDDEMAGAEPFSGADGAALKASLARLGYPPEDWATLLTVSDAGEPLSPELLREAIAALDPATLILCDDTASAAVREAFADELVAIEELPVAMLEPGYIAYVRGIRTMSLGGFAGALVSPQLKQLMWARLKQLPPLGEPF